MMERGDREAGGVRSIFHGNTELPIQEFQGEQKN